MTYVQTLHSLSDMLQYPHERRVTIGAETPGQADIAEPEFSQDTRLTISSVEHVKADEELCRKLRCERCKEWVKMSGLRRINETGTPICWSDVYLLPEYSRVSEAIGLNNMPVYGLVQSMFGEQVEHVSVDLYVERVHGELAAALELKDGAASLTIARRYTGSGGRLFQVSFNIHPEDRFTYSFNLQRDRRGGTER